MAYIAVNTTGDHPQKYSSRTLSCWLYVYFFILLQAIYSSKNQAIE